MANKKIGFEYEVETKSAEDSLSRLSAAYGKLDKKVSSFDKTAVKVNKTQSKASKLKGFFTKKRVPSAPQIMLFKLAARAIFAIGVAAGAAVIGLTKLAAMVGESDRASRKSAKNLQISIREYTRFRFIAAASGKTVKELDKDLLKLRKANKALIPTWAGSAKEIAAMKKEADDLGLSVSGPVARASEEFANKWRVVGTLIKGIKDNVLRQLQPALTVVLDKGVSALKKLAKWVNKNKTFFSDLASGIVRGFSNAMAVLSDGIATYIRTAGKVAGTLPKLFGFDFIIDKSEAAAKGFEGISKEFREMAADASGLTNAFEKVEKTKPFKGDDDGLAAWRREWEKTQRAIDATDKQLQAFEMRAVKAKAFKIADLKIEGSAEVDMPLPSLDEKANARRIALAKKVNLMQLQNTREFLDQKEMLHKVASKKAYQAILDAEQRVIKAQEARDLKSLQREQKILEAKTAEYKRQEEMRLGFAQREIDLEQLIQERKEEILLDARTFQNEQFQKEFEEFEAMANQIGSVMQSLGESIGQGANVGKVALQALFQFTAQAVQGMVTQWAKAQTAKKSEALTTVGANAAEAGSAVAADGASKFGIFAPLIVPPLVAAIVGLIMGLTSKFHVGGTMSSGARQPLGPGEYYATLRDGEKVIPTSRMRNGGDSGGGGGGTAILPAFMPTIGNPGNARYQSTIRRDTLPALNEVLGAGERIGSRRFIGQGTRKRT